MQPRKVGMLGRKCPDYKWKELIINNAKLEWCNTDHEKSVLLYSAYYRFCYIQQMTDKELSESEHM